MSAKEKLLYFILAFIAGGVVGLTFYGGLFKDSDGNATLATSISNLIVFAAVGLIAAKIFIPMRTKQLQQKRLQELTMQFRSLLETLAVSLSSGMNMSTAILLLSGIRKAKWFCSCMRPTKRVLALCIISTTCPSCLCMRRAGKSSTFTVSPCRAWRVLLAEIMMSSIASLLGIT